MAEGFKAALSAGLGQGLAGLGGLVVGQTVRPGQQNSFVEGFQGATQQLSQMASEAEAKREAERARYQAMVQQLVIQNPQAFIAGAPGAMSPAAQEPFLKALAEPLAEFSNQPGTSPGTPAFESAQALIQAMGTAAMRGPGLKPADVLRAAELTSSRGDDTATQELMLMIFPDLVLTSEQKQQIDPETLFKWGTNAEYFTPESRVAFAESSYGGKPDIGLLKIQDVAGRAPGAIKEQLAREYWQGLRTDTIDDGPEWQARKIAFLDAIGVENIKGMSAEDGIRLFTQAVAPMSALAVYSDDPGFMQKAITNFTNTLSEAPKLFEALGINPDLETREAIITDRFQKSLLMQTPNGRQLLIDDLRETMLEEQFDVGGKEPLRGATIFANNPKQFAAMMRERAIRLNLVPPTATP